jgi:hypothetical protein
MSIKPLTGYDNTDVSTGEPDAEVFVYNDVSEELVCASCDPDGERPTGPASVPLQFFHLTEPNSLSDDGSRAFFTTPDALVPEDTNGKLDVYGFSDGRVSLVSSGGGEYGPLVGGRGVSDSGATLAGASADGNDVFFATRDRLVARDTDEHIDMYDSRVDGGEGEPSAEMPACIDEACKPAPSEPARLEQPGSASVTGPGNLKQTKRHKKPKPHKKKQGHRKKHAQKSNKKNRKHARLGAGRKGGKHA